LEAENSVKKAENEKYEIDPITKEKKLKKDYLSKIYNLEERTKIIDLVKFYSDWLYSPVDEELENKLYFLDSSLIEENFYENIKKEFENTKDGNKMKVLGIKIKK